MPGSPVSKATAQQNCAKPCRLFAPGAGKSSRSLTDLATRLSNGFVEGKNKMTRTLRTIDDFCRKRLGCLVEFQTTPATWEAIDAASGNGFCSGDCLLSARSWIVIAVFLSWMLAIYWLVVKHKNQGGGGYIGMC